MSNQQQPPISERGARQFWARVKKTKTCWLIHDRSGYGKFSWNGTSYSAHRLAWELENGPVAEGLWVLHRCDVKACVRPDHLFVGTRSDNVNDFHSKGLATPRKPLIQVHARLFVEDVEMLKRMAAEDAMSWQTKLRSFLHRSLQMEGKLIGLDPRKKK